MIYDLHILLDKPTIDMEYRKSIISFIKHALEKSDKALFNELYGDHVIKPFCFAPRLPDPKFDRETQLIKLSQPVFSVKISFADSMMGARLYNALLKQRYLPYKVHGGQWTLEKITPVNEQLCSSGKCAVRFAAPLVVRGVRMNGDNEETWYYAYGEDGFDEALRRGIRAQLRVANLDETIADSLSIQSPNQLKKIIVKHYGQKIPCTIGTCVIQAPIAALNYLLMAGIGARHSEGFGLMERIGGGE